MAVPPIVACHPSLLRLLYFFLVAVFLGKLLSHVTSSQALPPRTLGRVMCLELWSLESGQGDWDSKYSLYKLVSAVLDCPSFLLPMDSGGVQFLRLFTAQWCETLAFYCFLSLQDIGFQHFLL